MSASVVGRVALRRATDAAHADGSEYPHQCSPARPSRSIGGVHGPGREIERPVQEVFDFVADQRNEPSYNPRMVRAEKASPGPVGPGIWTDLKRRLEGRPPQRGTAAGDFARCARRWARLAMAGRLASPRHLVGTTLRFEEGTPSLIFRETVVRGATTSEPVLLVIRFRLAALGSSRLLHAAFRRECVLHTPLFAGFPGFRSKLWIDDVRTGTYRGVYEWDGAERARAYAERMVALLAPFSTAGTARFEVVEGLSRDEFLAMAA